MYKQRYNIPKTWYKDFMHTWIFFVLLGWFICLRIKKGSGGMQLLLYHTLSLACSNCMHLFFLRLYLSNLLLLMKKCLPNSFELRFPRAIFSGLGDPVDYNKLANSRQDFILPTRYRNSSLIVWSHLFLIGRVHSYQEGPHCLGNIGCILICL